MQFSQGQLIFSIVFLVLFVIGMVYSYAKDKNVRNRHYKGSYVVLVGIIVVVGAYFLLVKFLK
jgi:uncharacterized membrane protein